MDTQPSIGYRKNLLIKAYHEAGHAVVSHYYKRCVHYIEIGGDDHNFMVSSETPSLFELAETYINTNADSERLWEEYVEMIRVHCAILAAGPSAESNHTGVDIRQIRGGQDFETIIELTRHLSKISERFSDCTDMNENYKRTLMRDIFERPQSIFMEHRGWLYVERIVGALLMKYVLTRDDLEVLLTGMPQSDGHVPYSNPTVNFQYAMRF